ncbi:MAG: thioredoxin-disulfide reductase [Chloroflexi bacterium]|nr:thioredoxin-disulfide reductase [Chloroflexota bacterium]
MLDFRLQPQQEQITLDQGKLFDVIIIGGGPAGLSAGLYAARNGLNVLLLEGGTIGGQAAATERIENWPGCHQGTGAEVMGFLRKQAEAFGLKVLMVGVTDVDLEGRIKQVYTPKGTLRARSLIVATGAKPVKLGVPGEERLQGHGVSYCATCDAPFFRDKVVAVVGGGESALKEGDFIARFASKVYVIHRRDTFRAAKATQDRMRANHKAEFQLDTIVEGLLGDNRLTGLQLRNTRTGKKFELRVDGMFVYVGLQPNVDFLKGKLKLSPAGYILADVTMATSVPGVFAAGDVRETPLRQVVTATADGAIAAESADKYIQEELVEVPAWKATA